MTYCGNDFSYRNNANMRNKKKVSESKSVFKGKVIQVKGKLLIVTNDSEGYLSGFDISTGKVFKVRPSNPFDIKTYGSYEVMVTPKEKRIKRKW